MSNHVDSPLLPEWDSDAISLKDMSSKNMHPAIVRVVKGHYMNIGVHKLPLTRMQPDILLHSVSNSIKVFCHSVRIRSATKSHRFPYTLISLDQRLSIPLSYQGWFELLSEDGKAAKPIESVHDLARRLPHKCIVRQNIKGYLANSEGDVDFDRQRIVSAGEILTLNNSGVKTDYIKIAKTTLLRVKDNKGEIVFLSFDQKGLFTPVAGHDGISGVHTIRDIVSKFRLPLTVKLTQGVWPKVDQTRFTGVVRLDWVYNDNTSFVCPFVKDNLRMLPIPADAQLKVCTAKNMADIRKSDLYKAMLHKCDRMLSNYNNAIHLVTSVSDSTVLTRQNSNTIQQSLSRKQRGNIPDSNQNLLNAKEAKLLDEIDDIYQYVRGGGTPPETNFTFESDEGSNWEDPVYETIGGLTELEVIECGTSAANMNTGSLTLQHANAVKTLRTNELLDDKLLMMEVAVNGATCLKENDAIASGKKITGTTSKPSVAMPDVTTCVANELENCLIGHSNKTDDSKPCTITGVITSDTIQKTSDLKDNIAISNLTKNAIVSNPKQLATMSSSFKENENDSGIMTARSLTKRSSPDSQTDKTSTTGVKLHSPLHIAQSVPPHNNNNQANTAAYRSSDVIINSCPPTARNMKVLKKQISSPAITIQSQRKRSLNSLFHWKRSKSISPPTNASELERPSTNKKSSYTSDNSLTISGIPSSSTTDPISDSAPTHASVKPGKKSHEHSRSSKRNSMVEVNQSNKFHSPQSKSRDIDSMYGFNGSVRRASHSVGVTSQGKPMSSGAREKRNSVGHSAELRNKLQSMYL